MDASYRIYMRRALTLAIRSRGRSSPNPTVGCVIVREGKILGAGWHDYGLMDHAEIVALRAAGEGARGATAYVSLEPCCHQGRTPPCTDALIQAGIARVVAATLDPNPKVAGNGLQTLRTAGIRTECGLLRDQADELIEAFACHITRRRPLVIAKVGMSLDGRIGVRADAERTITSAESAAFVQRLRHQADAILVGIGTMLADDPELTFRGAETKRRALIRVILDSHLRTPATARIFRSAPATPILIFCGPAAAMGRRKTLQGLGAEIVSIPGHGDRLDVARVLRVLAQKKVLSLLVEGGSEVHWSFLARKLVDKFYFVVAPLVLGGRDAVAAVGGEGYGKIRLAPRFKIRRKFASGPDFIFESYPAYSKSILSPWRY
jgi:diaminohydroxyphosphoribosylaminopyrimidine deaminase/5-amino-6-(5-phosphoribosylamino)uracil reductase